MPEYFNIKETAKLLVTFGIGGLIFLLVVILAVVNLKSFRKHYKTGLIIGIALFIMMLPAAILTLAHLDLSPIFSKYAHRDGNAPPLKVYFYIGLAFGALILILKIGWQMVVYYVAASEWSKLRPDPFPLLMRTGKISGRTVIASVVFGIVVGAVSFVVFQALGVLTGKETKGVELLFPNIKEISLFIQLPLALLAMSVPAITEELAFRGVLLAFLLRLSKNSRAAVVTSILMVSMLWAFLHLFNTGFPLIKCIQIFIVGIALCEIARRSCLENAIIAHLSFNITATLLYYIVY
jgi:membrane protease YdiL (CAAX protease family)